MYKRNVTTAITEALEDTPVILLNGARQTGKSTLCKQLLDQGAFGGQMVTFDDPATLSAAQVDPLGFLENLGKHLIIDEVQRVPELFLSIKKLVDEDRKGRRFILTGSVDVMTLPKVADSLAGRIEMHSLWPLSQDELLGKPSGFLQTLFSKGGRFPNGKTAWKDVIRRIVTGGYPEAVARKSESRRTKWFESYMRAVMQKDIRDLANIEGLTQIPNILQLIGARVGSTINMSDISRLSGVKNTTLQRYIALLEHVFLIVRVPAWTPNAEGQYVKSPKVFLNDTGLLTHLRRETSSSLAADRTRAGAFLENFVAMEIVKQLSWPDPFLNLYHFSIHKGSEVDLVIENGRRELYGIEVKSTATLKPRDFRDLKRLAELAGDKFQKGIVIYNGETSLGFGKNLYAVPLSALWQG